MKNLILAFFILIQSGLFAQLPSQMEIQEILDKKVEKKEIFGASISIKTNEKTYAFSSGNLKSQNQYFIASITKMYTASILFILEEKKLLNLDDLIKNYLSSEIINGLNIYKGVDYSNQ